MNVKKWFLAMRPWSFSMSAISVTIGALWSVGETFSFPLYFLTLVAMISLHGATNLINDYFDVKSGVDVPDAPTVKYRPHPLAHQEIGLAGVLAVAVTMYAVGAGVGFYLVYVSGWELVAIGAAGVFISVFYTAWPAELKYKALGEVAVFLCWGPLAVLGANFVQTGAFSPALLLVSIPFGLLVGLVLLANNLRDTCYDSEQNITTVPILLGESRGRALFIGLVALSFISVAIMSVLGPLGWWSLIVLLALPVAAPLCKMVYTGCPDDADARTAKLDTVFGILLALSILAERLF